MVEKKISLAGHCQLIKIYGSTVARSSWPGQNWQVTTLVKEMQNFYTFVF